MADRHHGYHVSVGYTANFFPEMAPDWLDFCIRAQGFKAPRAGPAYRYLDLGSGQGFHLCLLAAANPEAEFVGIDFQDGHIAHAQDLAAAGGLANVRFVQADFLDLAATWPADLGAFDYIALQGILSWISDELRAAVFQCVANAGKPGTIASFGYNSQPGWLNALPFQHIAHELGKSRDANAALEGAFIMFRRLRDAKSPLYDLLPRFRQLLDVLGTAPTGYLAHEFLTDHWTPLWHSSVAHELRSRDFSYVGSANVAEALLPHSLPPELRAVILDEPDESLRQDVQDIVITQQFRRDIFGRDPRPAEPGTMLDDDARLYLFAPPPEGAPVHFKTTFGGLAVNYAGVADILAAVADGPRTVAELMALANPARPDTRSVLLSMLDAQMLMIGAAMPGSPETAERFNAAVARAAATDGKDYQHVAASALGAGVPVSELNLLLLDTWLSSDRTDDQAALAKGVAQRLKGLGRQLQFRGTPIADEQLETEMARVAAIFVDQVVPQWRRLGVLS
jgi:SAM-dependent methyltransferase